MEKRFPNFVDYYTNTHISRTDVRKGAYRHQSEPTATHKGCTRGSKSVPFTAIRGSLCVPEPIRHWRTNYINGPNGGIVNIALILIPFLQEE